MSVNDLHSQGFLPAKLKCHFTIGIWAHCVPKSQNQRKVLWEHQWHPVSHPVSWYPFVLFQGVLLEWVVGVGLLVWKYGTLSGGGPSDHSGSSSSAVGKSSSSLESISDGGVSSKVNHQWTAWQKGKSSLSFLGVNGEVGYCAPL